MLVTVCHVTGMSPGRLIVTSSAIDTEARKARRLYAIQALAFRRNTTSEAIRTLALSPSNGSWGLNLEASLTGETDL